MGFGPYPEDDKEGGDTPDLRAGYWLGIKEALGAVRNALTDGDWEGGRDARDALVSMAYVMDVLDAVELEMAEPENPDGGPERLDAGNE